jgi:hypothetical protein
LSNEQGALAEEVRVSAWRAEVVAAAFQRLRELCDPRGHAILAELELLYINELAVREGVMDREDVDRQYSVRV